MKSVAILGGGNGAHTMAADLSLRGYKVRMYEDSAFIGTFNVQAERNRRIIDILPVD